MVHSSVPAQLLDVRPEGDFVLVEQPIRVKNLLDSLPEAALAYRIQRSDIVDVVLDAVGPGSHLRDDGAKTFDKVKAERQAKGTHSIKVDQLVFEKAQDRIQFVGVERGVSLCGKDQKREARTEFVANGPCNRFGVVRRFGPGLGKDDVAPSNGREEGKRWQNLTVVIDEALYAVDAEGAERLPKMAFRYQRRIPAFSVDCDHRDRPSGKNAIGADVFHCDIDGIEGDAAREHPASRIAGRCDVGDGLERIGCSNRVHRREWRKMCRCGLDGLGTTLEPLHQKHRFPLGLGQSHPKRNAIRFGLSCPYVVFPTTPAEDAA